VHVQPVARQIQPCVQHGGASSWCSRCDNPEIATGEAPLHGIQIRCPRLCFVGSADEIDYDERWGGVHVSMAGPVIDRRAELEALGWQARVLEGLDHTQAMQAAQVVPILRPWLITQLGG
jgi:hypothetical protein